jgi:hypothetical protein
MATLVELKNMLDDHYPNEAKIMKSMKVNFLSMKIKS